MPNTMRCQTGTKHAFSMCHYDMKVLILSDINDVIDALIDYRDVNTNFAFNIITYQELSNQKYDVGYFHITNEDFAIYNSIYPLFHKIVSIFQSNLRKYMLSADFIIIPKSNDLFVKVRRCNCV